MFQSLGLMSIAHASEQTAAPAAAAGQQSMFEMMVPFLLIFVAMYFIMIRPQAKKAREHSELLKALKPGDEVVTSGGIIARIKSITDEFITLDIGNAQLKILKEHVVRFGKKPGDQAPKS
jgi:preprotein translocase subunit YajC